MKEIIHIVTEHGESKAVKFIILEGEEINTVNIFKRDTVYTIYRNTDEEMCADVSAYYETDLTEEWKNLTAEQKIAKFIAIPTFEYFADYCDSIDELKGKNFGKSVYNY